MNIAILGAECTGKTQLAQALVEQLKAEHPGVQWLPEYLRAWCALQGRTPRADEQAHIAQTQFERLQALATAPIETRGTGLVLTSWVVCDTTPLMTAIYSDLLFGDTSLYAQAIAQQRSFDLTLVAGLDLPWEADGIQRDGLAMRTLVDQRLRAVLQAHGLGFSSVYGVGEARTRNALQAVTFALGTPRAGHATSNAASRWRWACDKCSDPDCEHRLFSDLQKSR